MPPQQQLNQPSPSITPELPPLSQPENFSKGSKRDTWRSVISTILILIAAPIIALAITGFIFQSYEVYGPSMETTLHDGDRLIVLKLPATWAHLRNKDYVPNRTDVIVFNKNDFFSTDDSESKQLIKRVIALPGERVVVKDNSVTVYNKDHPDGFQPDKTFPYGSAITTTTGSVDLVVGPGELFVLGDNRPNSLDSRSFGTIREADVVGRASVRILPLDKIRKM